MKFSHNSVYKSFCFYYLEVVTISKESFKKYVNCEVLNSYYVVKDGKHYWYEVILVDRVQVSTYKGYSWLTPGGNKGRVYRGITSAGRKSRGLRNKGKGAEKIRPSLRANKRRGTN